MVRGRAIPAPPKDSGTVHTSRRHRAQAHQGMRRKNGGVLAKLVPAGLGMRWEALAINADFWSQVLQSASLRPLDFALGAAMIFRRDVFDASGGFQSFADHLADDYHLGRHLARGGRSIQLSQVVVQ